MKKVKKVLYILVILLLTTMMCTEDVSAKITYKTIKKSTLYDKKGRPVAGDIFKDSFKYAQGTCCIGNKIYMAFRDDNGNARIKVYDCKKKTVKNFSKNSFRVGNHANSMTYCKKLGGIVISSCDTSLRILNLKKKTIKKVKIGIANYAVGYSEKLGLIVGQSETRKFHCYKISKNMKLDEKEFKKRHYYQFNGEKFEKYERQGIEVVDDKVYIVQDLVGKENGDLNKHYSNNRILYYQIGKNEKGKYAKKLVKAFKISIDREFEELCYSSAQKKFYILSNKNYGTRNWQLCSLKKDKLK